MLGSSGSILLGQELCVCGGGGVISIICLLVSLFFCVSGVQAAVGLSVWKLLVFLQQCQRRPCKFHAASLLVCCVRRVPTLKPVCCAPVRGEAGPRWVCVPQGRQQPRQEPGGCAAHPPHEGWRNQTHRTPLGSNPHIRMRNGFSGGFNVSVFSRRPTWSAESSGKVSSTLL